MAVEILIDRPVDWLQEHDRIYLEGIGEFEILSANKHGDLHVGELSNYWTVNISDDDVTVL